MTLRHDLHGAQQMRAALLLDQTADEKNDWIARPRIARVGSKEIEVDADAVRAQLRLGISTPRMPTCGGVSRAGLKFAAFLRRWSDSGRMR
jgi:hypothetical protein